MSDRPLEILPLQNMAGEISLWYKEPFLPTNLVLEFKLLNHPYI